MSPIDRGALIKTYVNQAEETLLRLEESLVTLEGRPADEELMNGIFRDVHRLKGDASLLGLGPIAEYTHVLEDALDKLRNKKIPVTGGVVSFLLKGLDAWRELQALATGSDKRSSAAEGAALSASSAGARSVHVSTEKLDKLLDLLGEMAVGREKMRQNLTRVQGDAAEDLLETHRETDRLYMDIQEVVLKARMVPLGPLFHSYSRVVRDLSRQLGKTAKLVVEGEDVEVDTAVVENLRDPLTHMVRNALDHGLETPEERGKAGKDLMGTVKLSARHEGGFVIIEVSDDGRGLDRVKIAAQAKARGVSEAPAALSDAELFDFIFAPGFSTAGAVTSVSGRGVGLDIARKNVEALRGVVSAASAPGGGAVLTVRLPLTLAIIQGFGVEVGPQVYVVPLEYVAECFSLPPSDEAVNKAFGYFHLRKEPLPYARLAALFGVSGETRREKVIVVQVEGRRAGLAVSALLGESQVVIKPLPRPFQGLPGLSGSAILGNGRVGLILDVPALLGMVQRASREKSAA